MYEKYGVNNVFELQEIRNKSKQTKLERYGDENYNNHEKFKQTCNEKYGVDAPAQNKEIREKQKNTAFDRYGGWWNKEQVSKTIQEKYGVNWYTETKDILQYTNTKESLQHQYNTKKKNNSFNTSNPENESAVLLQNKYPDVISQYKSEQYPFICDFYIPSLNLYIECNYHWTHGGHPYNEIYDKDIVKLWEAKNTPFYRNAINTWTVRDVNKRKITKENNLNWIEFFTIKELMNWIEIRE